MHFWSTNEQYVFEERLALLGVVGRRATRAEEEVALRDVERFRAERADKPVSRKKTNYDTDDRANQKPR